MKVILVIGAQATGKTQLIKKLMETSHKTCQYRQISHVAELEAVLKDEDTEGSIFLESNAIDEEALLTTMYYSTFEGQDIPNSIYGHPQLVEIIVCEMDSAPYYYFDHFKWSKFPPGIRLKLWLK